LTEDTVRFRAEPMSGQCGRSWWPRLRLALLLGGLAFQPAQASAEPRNPFDTVMALIHAGRMDEARAFAERIAASEQVRAANLAFIEALILKRRGELEKAAGLLDEVVARDPSSTRARQELAHTLFLIGDDDRARYHFEHLRETMDSRALAAVYDSFLTAIRDRRPWTVEGSIGFAPSTNINDGTPGSTVYIAGVPFTNENAALSGIGVSYGVSGSYRMRLHGRLDWVVGGSLSGASYARSRFDRLRAAAYSELAIETPQWRMATGVSAERTMTGWKGYGTGIGPYLSGHYVISGRGRIEGRLSWMLRNYDLVEAYDGSEASMTLAYRHVVSPRIATTIGIAAGMTETTRDFTSYRALRPSAAVDYIVNRNLILHGGVAYENRKYNGDFPLTGKPRSDDRINLAMGATLRGLSWNGLVPRLNYEYFRASSNVDLFDRDSHGFGIVITRKY
jgi:hypothetical protein